MRIDRRIFLRNAGSLIEAAAFGGFLSPLVSGRAAARFRADPDARAIVETTAGKVQGGVADGVHIYRGVPYGAPAGGRNRFRPPKKAAPWAGIREALDYGEISPQGSGIGTPAPGSRSLAPAMAPFWPMRQSEDCLNLNIWTPGVNDGGKRPVLVWLHGGGFETGSGNSPTNEGTNLARRGDAVVVAVNHRLGALGFLHLGEFGGGEFERAGNIGLLDLVLALEWVKDNIAGFGGDPGRVMIHGESGGGRKVSAMLALPAARGLFSRAAIQSGASLKFPSNDLAAKRASYVLAELGVSAKDAAKLQDVPPDALVAAQAAASRRMSAEADPGAPLSENYGFAPVIGPDLPHAPFDPAAPEESARVPLLIGTNRHEMALMFYSDPSFDEVDDAELMREAGLRAGGRAEGIVKLYREIYPEASNRVLLLLLVSDFTHRLDSIALAERKSAQGVAPVYMYRFDWETPALGGLMKAAHAFEIPHVFDNTQLMSAMTGGGPDARALAARMSSAWIAFARTGDPGHEGLPAWPAYNVEKRATMLFNDDCTVEDDPGGRERLAWSEILGR